MKRASWIPLALATWCILAFGASPVYELAERRTNSDARPRKLHKLIVIAISDDREVRNRFEDKFVTHLKGKGFDALISHELVPDLTKPADRQSVLVTHGSLDPLIPCAAMRQQVQILQMTNLLKHKNPYTNLTYAEDPAIAFLEIVNEQSILFYTSMGPLKASPTLPSANGRQVFRDAQAVIVPAPGLTSRPLVVPCVSSRRRHTPWTFVPE